MSEKFLFCVGGIEILCNFVAEIDNIIRYKMNITEQDKQFMREATDWARISRIFYGNTLETFRLWQEKEDKTEY